MTEPVFNHTAHKQLWLWLAVHPTKTKNDWRGWKDIRNCHVAKTCFACEYAGQSEYSLCIYTEICNGGCPLIWGGERNICFEEDAIFTQWEYASKNSHRTRKRLALQIANLPVREGVKCI